MSFVRNFILFFNIFIFIRIYFYFWICNLSHLKIIAFRIFFSDNAVIPDSQRALFSMSKFPKPEEEFLKETIFPTDFYSNSTTKDSQHYVEEKKKYNNKLVIVILAVFPSSTSARRWGYSCAWYSIELPAVDFAHYRNRRSTCACYRMLIVIRNSNVTRCERIETLRMHSNLRSLFPGKSWQSL